MMGREKQVRRAAMACALAMLASPLWAQAGADVRAMQARPMPPTEREIWVPVRTSSTACIDVERIGGAIVVDPRSLDILMRGGKRYRLTLAQACPQLSYYGGFYYQPTVSGKFCAGKDRVMARAGGPCRVSRISVLQKATPRR